MVFFLPVAEKSDFLDIADDIADDKSVIVVILQAQLKQWGGKQVEK